MPLQLFVTQQIINVHWGGEPKRFLYSGADGMFGSEDGEKWKKAPAAVPATSLAWVDGVWVAAGPGGCWRSEDGAKSWDTMAAPAFEQVAAMTPEGSTAGGGSKAGVFAGWLEDEDGENYRVYTSHDLGKSWSLAKTIPTAVGETGSETVRGLSGCGGGFFVCTVRNETSTHNGDGIIYSSFDGHSFSEDRVFGPGTDIPDEPFAHTIGYGADAVGFDKQSHTYIAIGDRNEVLSTGVFQSFVIYSESSGGNFGGSGSDIASGMIADSVGDSVSAANSAAGGSNVFATGVIHVRFAGGGDAGSGDLEAYFVPGSYSAVGTLGTPPQGFIGSFCFNDFAEVTTDTDNPEHGVFACVVFDHENSGGVYTSRAGEGFSRKHSGSGIDLAGGAHAGAVAVGNIEFLDET